MARRMTVHRTTEITILLADGDAPDMPNQYTVSQTFEPQLLMVRWISSNGADWASQGLKTSGPRRLKAGGLSDRATGSWHWYQSADLPDWAAPLIAASRPLPVREGDTAVQDTDPIELDPQGGTS